MIYKWNSQFNKTKWCKRQRLHCITTYIVQTRLTNNNWRQKFGHA